MTPFQWLVDGPRLTLATTLTREGFSERFAEHVERSSFRRPGQSGGFVGTLDGLNFTLHETPPLGRDNRPFFHGRLHPTPSGLEIHGHFSVHVLHKVFMILFTWVAALLAFGLCGTAIFRLFDGSRRTDWALLAISGAMVLLLVAVAFARVISKSKERMYVRFFEECFDATLLGRTS